MKKVFRTIFATLLIIMVASMSAFIISCSNSQQGPGDEPTAKAEVILNQTNINSVIGDKTVIKVSNAYKFDSITWSSDNSLVATVDQNGVVEAYGLGTTKIKATAANSTAECTVTVGLGSTLPRIMIENEHSEYRIGRDTTTFPFNVYVSFNGKTFNDVTVEYSSSDESVVKIGSDNSSFAVMGSGQAEITLNATWRGLSLKDAPSLLKTVKVSVVDELYFYVNGRQYSNIDLYTVDRFADKTYVNQMDFVPSVEYNGEESTDVDIQLPDILAYDGDKIVANKYGEGKIIMSYEKSGNTFYYSIDVTVERPQETYVKNLKYFSTFTGTYKDEEDGYANKSIVETLFGTTEVENLKAYQGKKELTVKDGKLLNVNLAAAETYNDTIRLETDKVIYDVYVTVYTLVIQSAEDLELFSLEILNGDNPETPGYDETEVTFIDGYCEVINNIDATGVKIEHPALNTTYDYVNDKGETVQVTVNAGRYNKAGGLRRYGFCGTLNGNGYTISNLDTSVEEGKIGGGLLGYMFGAAVVKDLALTNVNITNSSGITYGMLVPTPTGGTDSLGLKKDYTTFNNIYISLSKDTVNPQGALMWRMFDHWMGLYNFTNIIVDANGITTDGSTAGGVLLGEGTTFYKSTTYANRNNVYVISENYPITMADFTIYGENEANGNTLFEIVDGVAYTSGVKRYDTVNDMILAKNDYSSFGKVWEIADYPIFKTAFDVMPAYDGEYVYSASIIVNSATTGKQLELIDTVTGESLAVQFSGYDTEKLVIDSDGFIKLAKEVTAEEKLTLTLAYTYKDKPCTIQLTVRAVPSNKVIDEQIIMSAYSGKLSLEGFFEKGERILSATQILTDELPLTIDKEGAIKGVVVKIKSDYSDVENTTLKVTTNVTTYTFTNIKAYSHIISTASDLSVFERKTGASRTTGYYILANNIEMAGATVTHSGVKCGDTTNVFQGVFDGQGYSIIDFKPTLEGLFGSVYSDLEENGGKSIIRNVGFINVQSPARLASASDGGFTILGRYVNSAKEGLQVEITNVHVQILNTYCSNHASAPNYHGLFESNSAEASNIFNNFKMTNVYVEIVNEEFNEVVGWYHGTILSIDTLIVNSTIESRSARFDNVVTVSKASPLVHRGWDGTGTAKDWGIHLYFVYAENDVGKNSLYALDGETKVHNPIAEDKANGCYIYKNVYRYDTAKDAATAKQDGFIETGLWKLSKGELKWKTAPFTATAGSESGNFNPDWLTGTN